MEIQSRKMDANTSQRITALRFLLIIFVVFMHNNFTVESIAEGVAKGGSAVLFNQGIFGRWLQLFISAGIARGAVPLFMLFAAYLQEIKNDPYPILLKKKTKSLFLVVGILYSKFEWTQAFADTFFSVLCAASRPDALELVSTRLVL